VSGKAVARIGSTLAQFDWQPCPLAPLPRTVSLELGLEGFLSSPSRPIPKFRRSAAERFDSPCTRQGRSKPTRPGQKTACAGAHKQSAGCGWPEQPVAQEESDTDL